MEMVGMVDVDMVAEDVVVHGVVVHQGVDEAMVASLLHIMIMLNMMHHLLHVVSLHIIDIKSPTNGNKFYAQFKFMTWTLARWLDLAH